jgi:hypothetical protein
METVGAACAASCQSRISPLLTPQVAEMPATKSRAGNAITNIRFLTGFGLILPASTLIYVSNAAPLVRKATRRLLVHLLGAKNRPRKRRDHALVLLTSDPDAIRGQAL